jgi:hypothetical protein
MKSPNDIQEVAEPLSKGEKNFKAMHKVLLNKKVVPGVTDQDHVFKGLERKKDQPTASYEIYKSEDESKENYDKDLKVKDDYYAAEETVDEATLSAKAARAGKDIGKPGKYFEKIAKSAAEKYGSKLIGKKVAGAVLAKMRKEEVEQTDEALSKNWDSAHTKDKDISHSKPSMKNYRKPGEEMKSALSKMAADKVKDYLAKGGKIRKEEVEEIDERSLTDAEMKKREEIAKAIGRENPDMPMAKKMAIATAQAKKVTEDVDYDYEGEMAKAELRALSHKADALAGMMSDDQQLEAWLQSKISRAKDQIDAVYDYMMFREQPTPAPVAVMPTQSDSMAGTYGSFLNRMGEEVEQVEEDKEKDLAALAPPRDKVTMKDVLVGRGVLKKHPKDPEKHVLAKEDLSINSPALKKAFENINLGKKV